MLDPNEVATRIAVALLIQRGEITLNEIRAIPLVRDDSTAEKIFTYLTEHLRTESGQRKIASTPILRWERYVRLRDEDSAQSA